jgi:poly(A) polymerase
MSETLPSLASADWLQQPSLRRVMQAIAAAGGEARVAGGAVRNALLGEPVTEVDLATTLSPAQVAEACGTAGMSIHPTGIDHGTVTVVADHHPYEVTTLRHDVETDGRRAKVAFTSDWEADAQRRDFTINALYCDAAGRVYDFTGGYRDIGLRRVAFVGSADQRIEEDYLRILRFFRFHARYGEGPPDAAGLAACITHRNGLCNLSAERVRQEMFKLLVAKGAIPTLRCMAECAILSVILPYAEEWCVLSRLPADPLLRLAVLAQDPVAMKDRWRLSNHEAKRLEAIATLVPPSPALRAQEQRIILYQIGAEAWRDLVAVAWARSDAALDDAGWAELRDLPGRWQVPVLPVTGRDLIAAGMQPGPDMGLTLRRLEDWWVASGFKPGKRELLERISR